LKTNLIILPKERLISIDAVIPVIMELKTRHPKCRLFFVLPSKNHFEVLNKNVHLMECLNLMNAEIIHPPLGGRIIRFFYILRLLIRFSFSRNFFFKAGDIIYKHKIFMKILKKISRTKEIQLLLISPIKNYCRERVAVWKTIVDREPGKVLGQALDDDDDFLLTSVTEEDINKYYDRGVPHDKYIYSGYVRNFDQWKKFFPAAVDSYSLIKQQPYCLFILTTMGKRLNQIEEPPISEVFKESLIQLKQFNSRMHTVIRPHPITDMAILERILDEVQYENFTIDYGHPAILASKAEFVIGNSFSNTMYDAYILKRPIVLYTGYHKTWRDKFMKWPFVDFMFDRDPEPFSETISKLLDKKVTITRDETFIKENFPEPPKAFYDFFEKLLNT
jgi:hypothetical protein